MSVRIPIEWFETVDSTQNVIQERAMTLDNLSVVAAGYQTAGRGQRGNRWLAGKDENLTFSMLLRFGETPLPPMEAGDQFALSMAASMGVADYLSSRGIESMVKWPNDIYVRNRKICGMLIENVLDGAMVARSILGIGLNVNQKVFPGDLVNPVSMALLTGREYDLRNELPDLCRSIVDRIGTDNRADYLCRLFRRGVFNEFYDCLEDVHFSGRIVGVTPFGKLIIENTKGELKEFAFKEISYII